MNISREHPREMFGVDRYLVWAAPMEGALLQVVYADATTEEAADLQAVGYLSAFPKGAAYVLKALTILRGDPASPGVARG